MATNLTGILATQYSLLGRMVLGTAQLAWQRTASASDSASFTDSGTKQGEHAVHASDSASFTGTASVHGIHVASTFDSAIISGLSIGHQDDPEYSSDSASFTSIIASTVLRGRFASDSASFTSTASAGRERPVSVSAGGTLSDVAASHVTRPASASDTATFTASATDRDVRHAADSFGVIGTAFGMVVHHGSASDSFTITDLAGGFDPFLDEYAVDSARFSDSASSINHHGKLGMDTAAFSETASVVVHLGRFRRGDKVTLSILTPSTPDAPPIAVILDGSNVQRAALMMPATNQPRTFFRLSLPIGLTYSIGSFTVFFHYTIQGTSTLQQAAFDVIPGGDSGGSVIALYSLDRVEARCIVAQLDSGVLVLGKTPTVQA